MATNPADPFASFAKDAVGAITNSQNGVNVPTPAPDPFASFARSATQAAGAALNPAPTPEQPRAPATPAGRLWSGAQTGAAAVANVTAKALQPLFVTKDWTDALVLAGQALLEPDPAKRGELGQAAVGRLSAAQAHLTWGAASRVNPDAKREADRMEGSRIMRQFGVNGEMAGFAWDILADPGLLLTGGAVAVKGTAAATKATATALRTEARAAQAAGQAARATALEGQAARLEAQAAQVSKAGSAALRVADAVDTAPVRAVTKVVGRTADEVVAAASRLPGLPSLPGVQGVGRNAGVVQQAARAALTRAISAPVQGTAAGRTLAGLAGRGDAVDYGVAQVPGGMLATDVITNPTVKALFDDRAAKLDANMAGEQLRATLNAAADSGTTALKALVQAGMGANKKGLLELGGAAPLGRAKPLTLQGQVSAAVTRPVRRLLQADSEAAALRAVADIRALSASTGIPEAKFLETAQGLARADHTLGQTMEALSLARNITSDEAAGLFTRARTLDDLVPAYADAVIPKTRVGEVGVPVYVRAEDGAEEAGYVTRVGALDEAGEGTLTVTLKGETRSVPDSAVRIDELAADAPTGTDVRRYAASWTENGVDGAVIPGERARGYMMRMYGRLEDFADVASGYRARNTPDLAQVTDVDALAATLATVQRGMQSTPVPNAPTLRGLNTAPVPDTGLLTGGKVGAGEPLPPGPLNRMGQEGEVGVNVAAPLKPELGATPTNVRDTRTLADALVVNTKGNVDDAAQLASILTAGQRATEKLARGGYAKSTVERLERQERRVGHVTGGGYNVVDSGLGEMLDLAAPLSRADNASLNAAVDRAVVRDPEVWAGGLPLEEALSRVADEVLPYTRSADEAFEWAADAFNAQVALGRLDLDPQTGLVYNLRTDRWAGTEASYRASAATRKAAVQARLTSMGVNGKAAWSKSARGRWARQVKRLNGRLPTQREAAAYDALLAEHRQRLAVRAANPRAMADELAAFWAANPHTTTFDGIEALSRRYGGLPDDVAQTLARAIHQSEGYRWTAGDQRLAQAAEYFGMRRGLGEAMRPGGSNKALFRGATQEQFSWFQKDVNRQLLTEVDDASTVYIHQMESRVGRLSFAHNMQFFVGGLTRRGELVAGDVVERARMKWGKAATGGARLDDVLETGKWRGLTFTPDELAHLERFGGDFRVYSTTDEVRRAAYGTGWVRVDGRLSNLTGGKLREGDYVANQAYAHLMVASQVPDAAGQAKVLWAWWRREERLITSAWLSSTASAMNEFLGSSIIPVLTGRLSPRQLGGGFVEALKHRRQVAQGDTAALKLDLLLEQQGVKGSQSLLLGGLSADHLRDFGVALGVKGREMPALVEQFVRFRETRAGLRNTDRGIRHGRDYANVMASVQRVTGLGFTGTRASLFKFREHVTDLVREASVHAYIAKGYTPLDAARATSKIMGDMRALPLWAAAMGRLPLMGPFLAWTQHASTLTLVTLMTRPQGIVALARLPMAQDAHQQGGQEGGNVLGERTAMRAQFRGGVRLGDGGWDGSGQYLSIASYNFADTIPNMLSGFSSETAGPLDWGGQVSLFRSVWTGAQRGGYNVYSGILGFNKPGGFVEAFRADPQAAVAVGFQTLASGTRSSMEFGGRTAQAYARTIVGLSQLPDDGSAAWGYAQSVMGNPAGRLFVGTLFAGPAALAEWRRTGNTDASLPRLSTTLEGTPPQAAGTALARLLLPIQEVQGDPRKQGAAARAVRDQMLQLTALDRRHRRDLQWADAAGEQRMRDQRTRLEGRVREVLRLLDR